MKKVGLATALQNFGRFADGFPEIPSFDDMSHGDKVQQALDTARDHVQNVFSFASSSDLDHQNTLDLEASSNGEWDTPYGLDDTPDLEHSTKQREHDDLTTHNYTVATLGTAPSLSDVSSGHSDSDITEKNGRAKVGNASQMGWGIREKKKDENYFNNIYLNQLLREQVREQNRFLIERLKEAREFLANMSAEDLDTNNTSAQSIANREELRRYLEEQGLDLNDYIGEDGIIDRDKIDDALEAKVLESSLAVQGLDLNDYIDEDGVIDRDRINEDLDNKAEEYENANDGIIQAYAAQGASTEIDASNLLGTPIATQNFNVASTEVDGSLDAENEASFDISDQDPQEAANEMLASLGFPTESSTMSMDNVGFESMASIPATDNGGFESVASIPAADNGGFESVASIPAADNGGFESVASIPAADNGGFESVASIPAADNGEFESVGEADYDSISVAEAVAASDQPQEASLLPPGEWKSMEISSAFQEQSFATEATLTAANEPVYDAEEGTYDKSGAVAVATARIA